MIEKIAKSASAVSSSVRAELAAVFRVELMSEQDTLRGPCAAETDLAPRLSMSFHFGRLLLHHDLTNHQNDESFTATPSSLIVLRTEHTVPLLF